ncbi:MAG: rod shape-determining protein MreC [candidate division Zixibacteria bacterium]|jgi:rod shape-determining protein MreC|nr:rod shape-determining protein MreC [candidate division Zixibacteria bacterium]
MKWISFAVVKQKAFRTSLTLAAVSLLFLFLPKEARESVSAAIQTIFYSHFYGIKDKLNDQYEVLFKVYDINRQLNAKIVDQTLELTSLREHQKENERLRNLLGFKETLGYDLIPAEIIALDPKRRQNAVLSEISSEKSVSSNLPVVNVDGLVGKTTSVLNDLVTVELLTSPNCRVAARDANTRVLGIIRWVGGRHLLLDNVSLSDTVRVGDTIITSGLGGRFPENLPIGTISNVEVGRSPFFKTIDVAPFVDFGALDELMILKRSK